jgi:hypothetical protein
MQRMVKLALVAAAVTAAPVGAYARSTYLSAFDTRYKTSGTALDSCSTCHGSGGTSTFNPYGAELRASIGSGITTALTVAEPKDSDGDGFTNLQEIQALKLPGDPASFPAVGAPKIAVAPASLSFGTVTVGSAAQQTTTVSNGGTADLTVRSVAACAGTSTEFSASPSGLFTVAPGGSQVVTVRYAPVDAGADGGCFQIAHDDATSATVQVAVSGAGQSAPAAVLDVDITRVSIAKRIDLSRGGTVAPKVTVLNAGTVAGDATIEVEGSLTDAQGATAPVYSATQTVTLAPAATAKVALPQYVPSVPGVVTWTVTVVDKDPDTDVATATTKIVP